jgi:hypothetical protein
VSVTSTVVVAGLVLAVVALAAWVFLFRQVARPLLFILLAPHRAESLYKVIQVSAGAAPFGFKGADCSSTLLP